MTNDRESTTPDIASESNADYQKRSDLTVGELRKQYGTHLAPGYQDSDKIGEVLANAGVNTVGELLKQTAAGR